MSSCIFTIGHSTREVGELIGLLQENGVHALADEWRASELGCETIQSRQGYEHEGAFKLTSETKAISLKLGEPDLRLFDKGANYVELKPSELLRRDTTRAGIPWGKGLQQQAEREDKIYLEGH